MFGSNKQGQLGTGPPSKGSPIPILLQELSFARMIKIRAGSFSAAMSADQQLFVWGRGIFGEFYTPHRVKSIQKLNVQDYQISKSGLAVIMTRQGTVYSWGDNAFGQLGHGDYKARATPERINGLDGKRVSHVALGHEFVLALGLTLPQKDYIKAAKSKNTSILRTSKMSTHSNRSGSFKSRGKLSARRPMVLHNKLKNAASTEDLGANTAPTYSS